MQNEIARSDDKQKKMLPVLRHSIKPCLIHSDNLSCIIVIHI
jgi:hypothetical protein